MTTRHLRLAAAVVATFMSTGVSADGARALQPGLRVIAYDGYGTPQRFQVGGRVLVDKKQGGGKGSDSSLANVLRTLNDINSDEVPGVEVAVTVGGQQYSATTDADGMFRVRVLNLPKAQALPVGPQSVRVELVGAGAPPAVASTLFVAPVADAVGIVSDIDDTVLKSYVPDKVKMVGEVLTHNAATLTPVPGAAAAYQRAQAAGVDAIFYVSGSPQNLYLRLTAFLKRQGYPGGALFLKNLGKDALFGHDDYKLGHLEDIAQDNPGMRFILVGDSGERDPEIYRTFRDKHPERVLAVVIRKVPGSKHLEHERFADMVVVDDVYVSDGTIAALVPSDAPTPVNVAEPVRSAN